MSRAQSEGEQSSRESRVRQSVDISSRGLEVLMCRTESSSKNRGHLCELGEGVESLWVSVASCVKWGQFSIYCRMLRAMNEITCVKPLAKGPGTQIF